MANGHGGKRPNSGRKSKKEEYSPDDGELSPLGFVLAVMRDDERSPAERMDAAKAALPYCAARLQHISADIDSELNISLISYLELPDTES
jgi:hypothetical protein